MVNVAFDAPVDFAPRDQIEDAERRLYELAESGRYGGGFQKFETALTTAVDMAAARLPARRQALRPRHRGCKDLDSKMGGLQTSDLIIVAGRPGMGKTALATNIAYNVASAWRGEDQADGHISTVNGGIVGVLLARNVGRAARHPYHRRAERNFVEHIRRGGIPRASSSRSRTWSIELQRLPLLIDETGGLTVAQLAARARRLKRQKGLDLLVIDYIQLLSGSSRRVPGKPRAGGHRDHHRAQGAGQGTQRADHGVVAVVAQVENRDDKRPQLSDLRESGSIEQDADVVMFVFREEYYLTQQGAAPGQRRAPQVADRDGGGARQGRDHHRQAAPRPDRHRECAVRSGRHALRQPRRRRQIPERPADY